ncbi:MAG TPA: hypothetical protein VNP93_14345 [Gaiellaceae bacterium]|nr:hypothetical protein [Gaiellaceae bacterium]
MRRALAYLALGAAAVVVGLAVAVLVRGDSEEPVDAAALPLTQDPVRVTSRVEPTGAFFAQPVEARIDVQLDTTQVNPARVRISAEFDPYVADGPPTVERIDSGRTTRLTYRYPLRCLEQGCDPSEERGLVDFPTGRVVYTYQGDASGRPRVEEIDWAPFIVTGRVRETAVRDIEWRASESSLATVTYRSGPRTAAIVLLVLAALLSAGAAGIAWKLWGGRSGAEAEGDELERTPLAVVLEAARAAAANGDLPRRRRALESVARELGRIDLVELAADARTLAWSPRVATSDDVEELAQRAELAAEGSP